MPRQSDWSVQHKPNLPTAISIRDAAVQTDFFHFGSGSESFDLGEEPQQDGDVELVEDGCFGFLEPFLERSDTVLGFGLHRGKTF